METHVGWIQDIAETENVIVDYPILADTDRMVASLYDMIHPNSDANVTVRTVFVIDPNRKLRLSLTYPLSTGRNFQEILRAIEAMQMTEKHKIVGTCWDPTLPRVLRSGCGCS
ncbi:hypothetical protein CEN44_22080 [Fischerella muscicola CCMEE 5323]|uniref:Alkyl hydroperoxide reductase subunit C/ Thiol specific antioxidant domain-containing protein n=1 Tax=Fischerella muscicola CCMEE 5323 TaxID=2019572 RepID=A0A2N6JXZ2_FISMU|nr:redoxin domain-containing protein [Fischerella sp. FACHB-380]PLZ85574.1 hypothetical protein CEN44_22080 [Fischerella muscicola CCMEE 5323]